MKHKVCEYFSKVLYMALFIKSFNVFVLVSL